MNRPLKEQDLATEMFPKTVTVNGAGLLAWGARAKAGEVHIYRMVCDGTRNGIYTVSLLWLQGRKLYRHGESAGEPERTAPLKPNQEHKATMQAMDLFRF